MKSTAGIAFLATAVNAFEVCSGEQTQFPSAAHASREDTDAHRRATQLPTILENRQEKKPLIFIYSLLSEQSLIPTIDKKCNFSLEWYLNAIRYKIFEFGQLL